MSAALREELRRALSDLETGHRLRSPEAVDSPAKRKYPGPVDFSSNDYLGLSRDPAVIRAAVDTLREWGTGSGASRLLSGNKDIHLRLEAKLAGFKKEEAALTFSSGYMANLGVLTALLNEKDVVLVDRLNHASLIDGARLSRAKLWVYPHRDADALEKLLRRARRYRRKMVVTDAYFSMDGHVAPLQDLTEICRRQNALLMVDEAHSTGVYGKTGRGLTEHFNLADAPAVQMGTLSKALGSAGGFIAGSRELIGTLVNLSRPFIYTTAPPPAASAAALAALQLLEEEPARVERLWKNTFFLRRKLHEQGWDTLDSEGPIVPLAVGHAEKAMRMKEFLRNEGFLAAAIRPPTVPKGTDRIRLSVTAAHSREELTRLADSLAKARKKFL